MAMMNPPYFTLYKYNTQYCFFKDGGEKVFCALRPCNFFAIFSASGVDRLRDWLYNSAQKEN